MNNLNKMVDEIFESEGLAVNPAGLKVVVVQTNKSKNANKRRRLYRSKFDKTTMEEIVKSVYAVDQRVQTIISSVAISA